MAIQYKCGYCGTEIGRIEHMQADAQKLGFDALTPEERKSIITYNQEGDMIVTISCDYCSEALSYNPELALQNNPLQ